MNYGGKNKMNILAVGDIVGNIGVNKLKKELPDLKNKYNIDFTIVNGENAAEGMGITEKNFNDIIKSGADCITVPYFVFEKTFTSPGPLTAHYIGNFRNDWEKAECYIR